MNESRERRLNGVVGVFLLLVAVGAVALAPSLLINLTTAAQLILLGLAGICDVVAALQSPLTAQISWYRWSGVGDILLGLSLPLGFLDPSSEPVFAVVVGFGGRSLAAMGIDLVLFHGRYTRGNSFSNH